MAQRRRPEFTARQENPNSLPVICKFYGSAKGCNWGDNCYYSHDDPTSVPLCHNYAGNCQYGDNCNFRHKRYKNDLIKENNSNTDELCIYFNSPYGCSRKEKCRFKHIKQEKPEQDDTIRLYSMDNLSEMKLNLPQRDWKKVSKPTEYTQSEESVIRICQFNCLAQSLCYGVTNRVMLKCDKKYLIWKYRCKRILYEILQYKPDIVCLQEIDKIHFDSFYYPNLSSMQYEGLFLIKNNINNSSQSHVSLNDGIAIFWNTNKIIYLKKKFECILGEPQECCQVALGIRLGLKQNTSSMFDVWNTHLKAGRSNESEYKRVKQCELLIDFMKKYSAAMPIIFCGDLNLHFDDLINDKGIVVNANAYKLLTNADEIKNDDNDNDNDNKLIFKSLWNDNEGNSFSTYAGWKDRNVKACFDYIMIGEWIDNNNNKKKKKKKNKNDFFVVKEVLNGWEQTEIEKYESKLPNEIYPSDHFLIAVSVAVQTDVQQQNKKTQPNDLLAKIDELIELFSEK